MIVEIKTLDLNNGSCFKDIIPTTYDDSKYPLIKFKNINSAFKMIVPSGYFVHVIYQ